MKKIYLMPVLLLALQLTAQEHSPRTLSSLADPGEWQVLHRGDSFSIRTTDLSVKKRGLLTGILRTAGLAAMTWQGEKLVNHNVGKGLDGRSANTWLMPLGAGLTLGAGKISDIVGGKPKRYIRYIFYDRAMTPVLSGIARYDPRSVRSNEGVILGGRAEQDGYIRIEGHDNKTGNFVVDVLPGPGGAEPAESEPALRAFSPIPLARIPLAGTAVSRLLPGTGISARSPEVVAVRDLTMHASDAHPLLPATNLSTRDAHLIAPANNSTLRDAHASTTNAKRSAVTSSIRDPRVNGAVRSAIPVPALPPALPWFMGLEAIRKGKAMGPEEEKEGDATEPPVQTPKDQIGLFEPETIEGDGFEDDDDDGFDEDDEDGMGFEPEDDGGGGAGDAGDVGADEDDEDDEDDDDDDDDEPLPAPCDPTDPDGECYCNEDDPASTCYDKPCVGYDSDLQTAFGNFTTPVAGTAAGNSIVQTVWDEYFADLGLTLPADFTISSNLPPDAISTGPNGAFVWEDNSPDAVGSTNGDNIYISPLAIANGLNTTISVIAHELVHLLNSQNPQPGVNEDYQAALYQASIMAALGNPAAAQGYTNQADAIAGTPGFDATANQTYTLPPQPGLPCW